jgi:large subunit ribosomal protein L25
LDTVTLQAQSREILGKNVKLLRRQGLVPANVYGHRLDSKAVQLPERAVAQQVLRASGSTLFTLEVDGTAQTVLVKKIQRHPTTSRVLHVDFYAVAMTEKLRASVPLHFVGEAPAVRQVGGTLLHSLTTVEVESLPSDLPTGIEADLSGLETVTDTLNVSDLKAPAGVTILNDPDQIIATVVPPAVQVEEAAAAPEAPAAVSPVEAAEAPAAEAEADSPTE